MRKFFLVILAAVLLIPGVSLACDPNWCDVATGAEAQAFQNLSITYGQDAGKQHIAQTSWSNEVSDSYVIDGKVYGSIHTDPDTLFFVGLNGQFTKTHTLTNSFTNICADIYSMNGGITMVADAGASAASTLWSGAAASAGNSGFVKQVQTLSYGGMGYGTTVATGFGYTNVKAGGF